MGLISTSTNNKVEEPLYFRTAKYGDDKNQNDPAGIIQSMYGI